MCTDRYEWRENNMKRHREKITIYNLRSSNKTDILVKKGIFWTQKQWEVGEMM